jgi:deoxyribodipyrimidine photolyase
MTVWAYTCLEPDEVDEFAEVSFASVSELREFVQEKLNGRQLVFAFADDLLITSWAVSEEKGELYEVATTFLDHVLQQAQSKLIPVTRFRAKLAQIDVAAHDLVDA